VACPLFEIVDDRGVAGIRAVISKLVLRGKALVLRDVLHDATRRKWRVEDEHRNLAALGLAAISSSRFSRYGRKTQLLEEGVDELRVVRQRVDGRVLHRCEELLGRLGLGAEHDAV